MTNSFINTNFVINVSILISCILIGIASCHTSQEGRNASNSTNAGPLYVGLLLNQKLSDMGWDFNHDQARILMEQKYGKNVVLFITRQGVFNDNFLTVVKELIELNNCRVIMFAAFGIDDNLQTQAINRYEQTKFVTFVRTPPATLEANVFSVAFDAPQIFFLGGALAGLLSKTGNIGFVTSTQGSKAATFINGLYYGALLVNPNAKLVTAIADDVIRSKKSVEIMIERWNVDFFSSLMSDGEVQLAATKSEKYTFGYPGEFGRVLYGEKVVSGCVIKWAPVYDEVIEMMLNNTFKGNRTYLFAMEDNVVDLASYSSEVPYEVIDQLEPLIKAVKKSNLILKLCEMIDILTGKICPMDFPNYSKQIQNAFPSNVTDKDGCFLFSLYRALPQADKRVINLGYFTDEQVFKPIYSHFDEEIALIVIVSLMLVLIIISLFVVFKYSSTVLIVTTNPYFCYGFLLGALFGYSDIFFWMGKPSENICLARIWFLEISFTLMFGSLMGKTLHVYRMWYNPELKATKTTSIVITLSISFVVIVQMALVSIISGMKGYQSLQITSSELSYDQYYENCSLTNDGLIVGSILIGFNGVVMLIVIILGYICRNVSSKFNDVNSIIICVYSIIVSAIIIILLFVNLKTSDPSIQLKIMASGIFIYITLPLLTVFGPKFKTLYIDVSKSKSNSNSTYSSAK